MEIKELKKLIRQGDIKHTLQHLNHFLDEFYSRFASEVLLLSSRYNKVVTDFNKGVIPHNDYNIEINSITNSLINIIESLEGLGDGNFKKKKSKAEVKILIDALQLRFSQSRRKAKTIQSNPTRLREKNDICRELGEVFINHPNLIEDYQSTELEGIITGIANKYKRVPEITGLDFFEKVARHVDGNFTKACITNAIAEIIYTGQMRIGDDYRIYNILEILCEDASPPVEQNINRVRSELDYFLGKILPQKMSG